MDTEAKPSHPVDSYDDERSVDNDRVDEIPVPLDPPFDVPTADALEQGRTVVLDDDRHDRSG